MKMNRFRFFSQKYSQRGDMLVELLMSVALVALVMPFLFRYQNDAVVRAENIAVARQMENIQSALEKYIVANRDNLLLTVGKNITRVNLSDLVEYGANETIVAEHADDYQLRILKSGDASGQATLQGVIVFSSDEITPMRTREIVSIGGENMGFIEGRQAYGSFGAWHADTVDLGVSVDDGIVAATSVSRDNALYLWRMPSENSADATMMSALSLGGHDIKNAKFFNATTAQFDESLHVGLTVADNLVFQNRTTIDTSFETQNATCSGILSSDSRNMEISGTLTMADLGKFTNFTTGDLWVSNMTLAGLSIIDDDSAAVLDVNQSLDMTSGRIDTIFATVSFTGSLTPRLVVKSRIEDSINPEYYWDAYYREAFLSDASFAELLRMAPLVTRNEGDSGTVSGQIFSAVATNKNATAADFMNAIAEIQTRVRAKYRLLNLE